ncbi:hypothetical protein CTAM01_06470 [Colletotrichum tamarilloi]|uniref:Uncharacterized protein n=1 Tax=Colletotrichum tamarilloi TaxID=1209934 RepID=A0ABQ9RBE8_9PEZI|nr:uncharacterized protein CTAM01_06470 [Colletotrichum tamarilloi]KAK1500535.1 hypothetical protein CTAM01_06470 [Colletotrichum tamarilloi]
MAREMRVCSFRKELGGASYRAGYPSFAPASPPAQLRHTSPHQQTARATGHKGGCLLLS